MSMTFRINSPSVIYETIEDEVILIDLKTGTYYSLRDSGATAWQALEHGADERGIIAELERRYDASAEVIEPAVTRFLQELRGEGLVQPDEAATAVGVTLKEVPSERLPFRPPALEKHTDMQDLILIDPVHEVSAAGWPHRNEAAEASA